MDKTVLVEFLEWVTQEQQCVALDSNCAERADLNYSDGMFDGFQAVIEKVEELLK